MRLGKASSNVLKRSVLRQLNNDNKSMSNILNGAGIGENCAVFASENSKPIAQVVKEGIVSASAGERVVKEDAFEMEIPLGQLFIRAANALCTQGAVPQTAMVTLVCPRNCEEEVVKRLMRDASGIARQLNVIIVGGQTRISAAVTKIVATIVMTGLIEADVSDKLSRVLPGQDILISKWIGLEGTSYLASTNRDKLLKRYPEYLVDEAIEFSKYISTSAEAALALKSGVCYMHNASEGGILGAIWELCEKAGVGLTMDLKKIPIRQETVEVCECLGVNPYELYSGGCIVMTAVDGTKLKNDLNKAGINAEIVGKITDSNDRIITNDDEIRFMDRPKQDEIYRFLDEKR